MLKSDLGLGFLFFGVNVGFEATVGAVESHVLLYICAAEKEARAKLFLCLI